MHSMDKLTQATQHAEEVITKEDLQALLEKNSTLNHYIGFEISGKIHLGTGLMCMKVIKDLNAVGVKTHILLADWHTWINDKLGGDREMIKKVAGGYFKEGMIACYKAIGGDPSELHFVLGSELYESMSNDYWATVIEISKNTSLARMQRSISILGRSEQDSVDFAKLIYPAMQAADIFIQNIHIAHAGTDQRKAHVVARDVAHHLTIHPLKNDIGEIIKPVAIHHHLLLGLAKPSKSPQNVEDKRELWTELKMSKSKPNSAVFITDSADVIKEKIQKAYCPPQDVEFNPIIDWVKHLVLDTDNKQFTIIRDEKYGGTISYSSIEDLNRDYMSGALYPTDLKNALADELIEILRPVREHFADTDRHQLLSEMDQLTVTR
ncbi:tyrosine--tRNA ligase [candidate division WWE3 bacterium]|nr:tyrosine--tRNA ligase [candidate division WWE3 bacterium]